MKGKDTLRSFHKHEKSASYPPQLVRRTNSSGIYFVSRGACAELDSVLVSSRSPADPKPKKPLKGILRVGAVTYIIVFDPNNIIDNAPFARPHPYPA